MDLFSSIVLGIVQGATEFIPVSSSGHLIVFREFLGKQIGSGLAFDAVLQLATTLAVIVYFWKDIKKLILSVVQFVFRKELDQKQKNLIVAIVVGTIPAVVVGILLEDFMDTVFRNTDIVAATLILGSVIMYFAERVTSKSLEVNPKNGFMIGLFQCLALIPGMSRSGMTISGGLFLGIKREDVVKFSFLLSIPILLGTGAKKLFELESSGLINSLGLNLLFGSATAFIVGIFAIHFLVKFLRNNSMKVFVWYRVVLAIILMMFL